MAAEPTVSEVQMALADLSAAMTVTPGRYCSKLFLANVARHVIDARFEPCCLQSNGIL
jgi:hypothetical protein